MIAVVATLGASIGALGLAIGSFLNVVIWRVPRSLSVVAPPSACPNCHAAIRPRDNVPVLSWILLRGRCRDCDAPIAPRYPLIEAITGAAFLGVAALLAPKIAEQPTGPLTAAAALELIAFLYLAAISIALAAIDLADHRLPDQIVLPSLIVGAVLLGTAGILRGDLSSLATAAIGSAAALVFFYVIAFVVPGGMGLGDVKLAAVLGLFLGYLGWGPLAVGISSAFVLGGVFGIVLIVLRRAKRGSGIPFGPWMLAGTWLGVLFGDRIAGAYLSLVGLG